MGNCCCCTRETAEDEEEKEHLLSEGRGQLRQQGQGSGQYRFEQNLVKKMKRTNGVYLSNVAIVSLNDFALRASTPSGFTPDLDGLEDIVDALTGNASAIDSSGIKLGDEVPVSTLGKLCEGKSIYGADGHGGGCTVFKTKQCLLIVVYDKDPPSANNLTSNAADVMVKQGL